MSVARCAVAAQNVFADTAPPQPFAASSIRGNSGFTHDADFLITHPDHCTFNNVPRMFFDLIEWLQAGGFLLKSDRYCDAKSGCARPSQTCPGDLAATCGKAGPGGVAGYPEMLHVQKYKASFQADAGLRGVNSMDQFARCFGIWVPPEGGTHRRIDIVLVTPLEWCVVVGVAVAVAAPHRPPAPAPPAN